VAKSRLRVWLLSGVIPEIGATCRRRDGQPGNDRDVAQVGSTGPRVDPVQPLDSRVPQGKGARDRVSACEQQEGRPLNSAIMPPVAKHRCLVALVQR
jgi:hypothetical protein